MTTTGLERWGRLLLHAYPPEYRQRRGAEIVATLLDTARPGQRLPAADAADVVRAGLRERLAAAGPLVAAGARTTAPFSLALAAGISAYLWWRVEPSTVQIGWPYQTLGPLAYAGWIVAMLARTVLPAFAARAATIGSLVLTVATPVISAMSGVDRPPLWTILLLTGLGSLVLARGGPASTDERLALPTGTVAICLVALTLGRAWPNRPGAPTYYQPREVGAVIALTALVVLALTVRRPHAASGAVLLAIPLGWLGPYPAVPGFGRLAEVLFASCVAIAALFWLPSWPRPARLDPSFASIGSITVGSATGLAFFYSATGVSSYGVVTVLALLAAGACCGLTGGRLRSTWWATGTLTGLIAAWLVAVYDNNWSPSGWNDPDRTAGLVATLAFVPLTACALVAFRAVAAPARRSATTEATCSATAEAPVGTASAPDPTGVVSGAARRPADETMRAGPFTFGVRSGAAATLALSLAWLVPATVPYVMSWAPQLAVLIAGLVVATVIRPGPASGVAGQGVGTVDGRSR